VFSSTHPHLFDNSLLEIEEGVEEVDFGDLARVLDSAPATLAAPAVREEVFTGVIRNPVSEPEGQPEDTSDMTLMTTETTIRTETTVATTADIEPVDGPVDKAMTEAPRLVTLVQDEPMVIETQTTIPTVEPGPATIPRETLPLFVIDTSPSTSQKQIPVPAYGLHPGTVSLGERVNVESRAEPDSEDDIIVYDAPNPRLSTPRVEYTALAGISLPNHTPSTTSRQINPLRKGKFVHVVGRNARRGGGVPGVKRKRLAENGNFAAFGAMIAEARLRPQDGKSDRDPKEQLRRQGDSDIDWGEETDENEEQGGLATTTAEGMDLDPDLVGSGVTTAAMERFVEGINGNHVTMDDLEDANAEGDSSSDDEMDEDEEGEWTDGEDVERDEEMMLEEEFLAAQDGFDSSDDNEDDELDPRAGFQARLDRLRKKQQKMIETEEDGDEDDIDLGFEWGEGEDINVRMIYVQGVVTYLVYPGFYRRSPR
jgi:hypothetical protein